MSQLMLNSGGRRSNRFVVCNQSKEIEEEEIGQCVDDYYDGDGTGWKITRSGLRKTTLLRNCVSYKKYMSFQCLYFCMVTTFCSDKIDGCSCTQFLDTNNKNCHRLTQAEIFIKMRWKQKKLNIDQSNAQALYLLKANHE